MLRETVDEFVLHQIAREIRGKEFVGKLVEAAHEMADGIEDNPAARAWRMSRCANKPGQSYFRSDSVLRRAAVLRSSHSRDLRSELSILSH